jgi:hydroxypyruvate isomerase
MPKFSANLSMLYTNFDFMDRFASAARDGFSGVEYLFPYSYQKDQLVEALEKHNLKQVLYNLPAGDWGSGDRGIACDPRRVAEFRDGVDQAIDYGKALECSQINCLVGAAPKNVTLRQAHETVVRNLKYAGRLLGTEKIRLLIEPCNTFDIPNFFLNGSVQAIELIEEVGEPNLFLQYDVYHMQLMEGNLTNTLVKNLHRIAHIQIADVPGRHEPGTGEIRFRCLFEKLDAIGYTGWIGCEYNPTTTTEESFGWMPLAEKSSSKQMREPA